MLQQVSSRKLKFMVKRSIKKIQSGTAEPDEVFELAAEVFRVMSAPMRLKIISSLCQAEKNVTELLSEIDTTQPNMSQHLSTLYQAGVLGKRREGVQIFYRIVDERVANLCRTVCTQIAIETVDSDG
jgi:DNA-binding transcriptional ArsR family regulator